jgi:lipopolysaccharide/colanic/teichoic acid biosynthesis glycosyltransferase
MEIRSGSIGIRRDSPDKLSQALASQRLNVEVEDARSTTPWCAVQAARRIRGDFETMNSTSIDNLNCDDASKSIDNRQRDPDEQVMIPVASGSRVISLASIAKRTVDLLGATSGILVFGPLMVLIALAIRLESRGPIFFRQQRLGRGGRAFRIWKFRTMVIDAEQRLKELEALNESDGGVLFKLKQDPRISKVGRLLRPTSLDELPQLFNILMGEMSIVGPRPLPLRDCILLREMNESDSSRRLEVLPGLTGPWQVSGRSRLGAARMLELDCDYIQNWSLLEDLKIIFRTVLVMMHRDGAY